LLLAAQYYRRAAQQGHPDGANNFGFCLDYGCGVQQNIEMAAEFYKLQRITVIQKQNSIIIAFFAYSDNRTTRSFSRNCF
jgi:hypothetical protein